jgi:peptidoglycan hydrolase CwlO-like protein
MEVFKRRLRMMEENGTITYYEILFDANSFSDFSAGLTA